MLYFQIDPEVFQNEDRYVVTDVADRITDDERRSGGWLCRWDFQSLEVAEQIAAAATKHTGAPHVATDTPYTGPRFDVVQAPYLGDPVSYSFNGDSYPDGYVTKVSDNLRRVETSTGSVYYRRKSTGTWKKQGGTWSLVRGWRNDRNPEF